MLIASVGMLCAVGLNTSAACAAIRAGIAGFRTLQYYDDAGRPIVGSPTPFSNTLLKGDRRLIEMLATAANECIAKCHPETIEGVPLLLALPELGRPGGEVLDDETMLREFAHKLGRRFHSEHSRVIRFGHVGGFEALRVARQLLTTYDVSLCLICAADSLLYPRTLFWLEQSWRLKTENNSDGIIPGEAAAAICVTRSNKSASACLSVAGIGMSHEKSHVLSDAPLLGLGIASAAREALSEARLGMHDIGFRLTDAAGEQYTFKEQALLVARTLKQRRETFPVWHHANSIGDVGAASGLVEIAIANQAFQRGYAPGRSALASTSSIDGRRGVVVVRMEGPGGTLESREKV
jgi:3-oxoacyl-[acyl-carrier-protein] synthase-1